MAIAGVGGREVPVGPGVGDLHCARLGGGDREQAAPPGRAVVALAGDVGIGDGDALPGSIGLPPRPEAAADTAAVGPGGPRPLEQLEDGRIVVDARPHRQHVALHDAAAHAQTDLGAERNLQVGPVDADQVAAAGVVVRSAERLLEGEIEACQRSGWVGEEARGAEVAAAQTDPEQVLAREARIDREPGVVVEAEGIEQGKAGGRVGVPIHGAAPIAEGSHRRIHLCANSGGGREDLSLLRPERLGGRSVGQWRLQRHELDGPVQEQVARDIRTTPG